MEEKNLQNQIDALNNKMDIILDYVNQQRLKSETVEDLVKDVSIIGKDIYDSTVKELDKRQVEIDPAQLGDLAISFLRNIQNFKMMMDTLESAIDLSKELGPIVNEVIIDISKKLNEFERKGYFDLLTGTGKIIDNVLTKVSINDVEAVSNNLVLILQTAQKLSQPEIINSIDKFSSAYIETQKNDIPSYSIWKMIKEINSPEMKKNMGFMMTVLKNLHKIK